MRLCFELSNSEVPFYVSKSYNLYENIKKGSLPEQFGFIRMVQADLPSHIEVRETDGLWRLGLAET